MEFAPRAGDVHRRRTTRLDRAVDCATQGRRVDRCNIFAHSPTDSLRAALIEYCARRRLAASVCSGGDEQTGRIRSARRFDSLARWPPPPRRPLGVACECKGRPRGAGRAASPTLRCARSRSHLSAGSVSGSSRRPTVKHKRRTKRCRAIRASHTRAAAAKVAAERCAVVAAELRLRPSGRGE